MDGWMDGWIDGSINGWIDRWMDVNYSKYGLTDTKSVLQCRAVQNTHLHTYTHTHTHTHTHTQRFALKVAMVKNVL